MSVALKLLVAAFDTKSNDRKYFGKAHGIVKMELCCNEIRLEQGTVL